VPRPKLDRRKLAIIAVTLAPLAIMVASVAFMKAHVHSIKREEDLILWSLIYVGFCFSFALGLHFRQPPIDPASRSGIFARRNRPRHRLRDLVVYIALISPCFALIAEQTREHRIDRIAWYTEQEEKNLARALEDERLAAEWRERVTRGGDQAASRSWAAIAKIHEEAAALWRSQAARDRDERKKFER
jgi:hypothetical protein